MEYEDWVLLRFTKKEQIINATTVIITCSRMISVYFYYQELAYLIY